MPFVTQNVAYGAGSLPHKDHPSLRSPAHPGLSDNGGMDLQRLREDTRREHEATEGAMPLMEPGLTLDSYKALLRTLLPILRGWETWSAEHAPGNLKPLLTARRRSHLLERDLRSLGDPNPMAPDGFIPIDWASVTHPGLHNASPLEQTRREAFEAGFLGALYVLEGSTLGGRMIARHLQPAFAFQEGKGDAYFRGHGEQTGALWREITAAIAAVPEEYSPDLIEAAKRTFAAFRSVLELLRPSFPSSEPAGS